MRWILRGWERLTLYLPVLLMSLLALATYWLVRSTPELKALASVSLPAHSADYFMQQFSIKTFDAKGQLRSEVSGQQAHHFPDTETLEIDQVNIRSFDSQGRLSTATARLAISNADASEVQLRGGALVQRAALAGGATPPQPRLTFAGEFLHAYLKTERVTSDKPVVMTRDNNRFSADRMDFDQRQRIIELSGRVRAWLNKQP